MFTISNVSRNLFKDITDQVRITYYFTAKLSDTNPDVSQALSDAADALQSGDTAAAQQALNEAAQAMEDAGMSSTAGADAAADKTQKSGAAVAQAAF